MSDPSTFKYRAKTFLARVLHPVERLVDRLKRRAPKQPVIDGYLGYATPDTVVFRGRVLSAIVRREARERDSKWTNFLSMARLFFTDEVAEVKVECGEQTAYTDEEGYFTLVKPRNEQTGWVSAVVSIADYSTADTTLHALVPSAKARFGVISDVDDTVLETGAYSLIKNLWTSLTGNVLTRHVFPDAKDMIDCLHDGTNPVFFVSSSPWNLHGFLRAVFERHDVLKAPMFLRDLGLSETQFITGTHGGHKGAAIDTILSANPELPFVLVGDTGQEDAHVYLDAFNRHPGRITKVVLREPGPGPDADSKSAIDAMKKAGLDVQTGRDFTGVTQPET